jgi:hypothetical protein
MPTKPQTHLDRDPAEVLAGDLGDIVEAARKLRPHDQLEAWHGEWPVPSLWAAEPVPGRKGQR